jgi:hypothetical protein
MKRGKGKKDKRGKGKAKMDIKFSPFTVSPFPASPFLPCFPSILKSL